MEIENTLSKSINTTDKLAEYDASCKRLLSNKSILAWILKECLEEYKGCTVDEISQKYIEGEPEIGETAVHIDEIVTDNIEGSNTEDSSVTEGTVTYDIRFEAIAPSTGEPIRLIINIEAQNDFYPGYPLIKRGIYYCSRMISSQYERVFTQSHYEKLRKVYSIWICTGPPAEKRNTITQYSVTEKNIVGNVRENKEHYDLITAIMICLGDKENESNGILKLLEVLLSRERAPKEKKQILSDDFKVKMTKTLESEVSHMCNIGEGIARECRAEGRAEGRVEGKAEGRVESLQNLMDSMKLSPIQAMDALKIPENERDMYLSMLK